MEDASSHKPPLKSSSISKRFTYALIGVVTLLLMGFAAVAILMNVRKIDADLRDRLDNATKLAQVTLALPLWNLDVETINNFADAERIRVTEISSVSEKVGLARLSPLLYARSKSLTSTQRKESWNAPRAEE